ncbi:MAG: transporter substrate-binding domain-containing protein [Clostridia bacterium]|nr:transporter substrate-binding domain-containing protein [Clostridia bacterium]
MKKLITTIVAMLLACVTCFGIVGCGNKGEKEKLVIGYTIYPPMNYFDEADSSKLVGFDTELAIAVCEIMDVDYEFKEIVWKNKVMSLNSYEIDVVWNGMTITDELKEAMCITDPYLENKQVIVCKTADAAKFSATADKKGLTGFEVYVETGSAGESTAKGLGITPMGASAQKNTLLEVKAGTNRVAIIDKLMADVLVGPNSANPDLTYVDVDFPIEYFGIGCRKDDQKTCDAIEEAIAQLKADGTFNKLLAKYFG